MIFNDTRDENITFFLNEIENENNIIKFDSFVKLQKELNDIDITDDDIDYLLFTTYELNNIKQLLLICEYYGIRNTKLKKQDIIQKIMLFEKDIKNINIYLRRKELWYYMDELKNDKIMKKYIICSTSTFGKG